MPAPPNPAHDTAEHDGERSDRPPLRLERTFKDVVLAAIMEQDGKVRIGEGVCDSLSMAEGHVTARVTCRWGSPVRRG